MPITRRKLDRIASIVFLALWLLPLGFCAVLFYPMVAGVFTDPDDIEIAQPEIAVRDARALIAKRNANPAMDSACMPNALPPSLRIPNLRYAKIHTDHIDLVVARNPDRSLGARIWSERHRPHRDRPTRYRDVYFFDYANDFPESIDNIP